MGRIALNERLIGYDSNGKKCIICDFICDSVSDLPAQTVYTDYVLMIGCTASMIDSGDIYKINSAGTWALSQAGTGTYTKSEIDTLLNAKQDVLTFDATPTQNSTNPVTSGGIWTDQQRQQTEIDYAVNTGVKNLVNLSDTTPTVPTGLSYTDNGDGTFAVSGTLAVAKSITFPIDAVSGNLILSGCPSGGGESSYMLRLTKNGAAVPASTDTGSGSQIFSMDGTGYALAARFSAGNYMNVVFRPMIRHAFIADNQFVPYAPTNRKLYEMILALQ